MKSRIALPQLPRTLAQLSAADATCSNVWDGLREVSAAFYYVIGVNCTVDDKFSSSCYGVDGSFVCSSAKDVGNFIITAVMLEH